MKIQINAKSGRVFEGEVVGKNEITILGSDFYLSIENVICHKVSAEFAEKIGCEVGPVHIAITPEEVARLRGLLFPGQTVKRVISTRKEFRCLHNGEREVLIKRVEMMDGSEKTIEKFIGPLY